MQPDGELQFVLTTALKDTDVLTEQDLPTHVEVWLCSGRPDLVTLTL